MSGKYQRRHYEDVAHILSALREQATPKSKNEQNKVRDHVASVDHVADYLEHEFVKLFMRDNTKFKPDRFSAAAKKVA